MRFIDCKDELKNFIINTTQEEMRSSSNNKVAMRYIEGKVNSVIDDCLGQFESEDELTRKYKQIIINSLRGKNVAEIIKILKSESLFKQKSELIQFAKYLDLNIYKKQSYKTILKKVSECIYSNKDYYDDKYIAYTQGEDIYVLEIDKLKLDLIENYRSKARNDMKSIAKILSIDTKDDESAEDIRKKVINYIIKDRLSKPKK